MLSARWRSYAGVAAVMCLLVALAVLSVTLRPERTIPTFRIEFPDAAFVVEEDWVMPNERALNFLEYGVHVARTRVPHPALALMADREREVYGHEPLPDQTFDLRVKYGVRVKPGEYLRRLVDVEGWKLLPDTNPDYRVAVFDDSTPYSTPHAEIFESKTGSRQLISCNVYYYAGDHSRPSRSCGLVVPYHAQCSANKCTTIAFGIPPSQMHRWAELAEQVRDVLRPYEVEPDLKHWQERERIHSVPV